VYADPRPVARDGSAVRDAGHLAAEMLALADARLRRKLHARRQRMAAEVLAKSKDLSQRLRENPKSR